MEPEGLLPHLQVPATCSCSEPGHSISYHRYISWRSILILSSHLHLGVTSGPFPSVFPTNTLYTPLLTPYVLHTPPMSFISIWSPEKYLVRSRDQQASLYVIFSTRLLRRLSEAQIFSSAPYSGTPSAYIPPSV